MRSWIQLKHNFLKIRSNACTFISIDNTGAECIFVYKEGTFFLLFNIKIYNNKLLRHYLPTNYYTRLQGRYQQEQTIMTTPWD